MGCSEHEIKEGLEPLTRIKKQDCGGRWWARAPQLSAWLRIWKQFGGGPWIDKKCRREPRCFPMYIVVVENPQETLRLADLGMGWEFKNKMAAAFDGREPPLSMIRNLETRWSRAPRNFRVTLSCGETPGPPPPLSPWWWVSCAAVWVGKFWRKKGVDTSGCVWWRALSVEPPAAIWTETTRDKPRHRKST